MAVLHQPDVGAAGAAVNVEDPLTAPGLEEYLAGRGRARASRPRCFV
ncbi:hypothetical protein [Streptomyces luteogriseus]